MGITKDKIRMSYVKNKSWGITTSVDLHSCNPIFIRDAGKIREFVEKLCDLIKVKRFGECTIVHFGRKREVEGFSMTQLIPNFLSI